MHWCGRARATSCVIEFGLIAFVELPWLRVSPDGIAIFLDTDGVVRVALVEYKCPFGLAESADHPYVKHPQNTPPQYLIQVQSVAGLVSLLEHQPGWKRILARRLASLSASVPACAALASRFRADADAAQAKDRASVDACIRTAFFGVWQPQQLWVTHHALDSDAFCSGLLPRLRSWFFDAFLPAATHKFNGRLAHGETTPQVHAPLAGDMLSDEQLDAVAQSIALAQTQKESAELVESNVQALLPSHKKSTSIRPRAFVALLLRLADAYEQMDAYDVRALRLRAMAHAEYNAEDNADKEDEDKALPCLPSQDVLEASLRALCRAGAKARASASASASAGISVREFCAARDALSTLLKDGDARFRVVTLQWLVDRAIQVGEAEAEAEETADAIEARVFEAWVCADAERAAHALWHS